MANKVKWLDENCHKCGARMNSWDARLTKTFKVRNTCEKCFARFMTWIKTHFVAKWKIFGAFVRVRGSDYGI